MYDAVLSILTSAEAGTALLGLVIAALVLLVGVCLALKAIDLSKKTVDKVK